jgi:hypothetical protein
MIEPELLDVVELIYPVEEGSLVAGMQGTLVERYSKGIYEVEFVAEDGETIALLPLTRDRFIVVWQVGTGRDVPLAEQVAQVVALLPREAGSEVLDFARFLSFRQGALVAPALAM